MKTSLVSKLLVGLALISCSAPSVLADDNNRYGYNSNNYHDNHRRYSKQSRKWKQSQVNKYNNNINNNWKWDKHNWNDQRAQLRANWKLNNANHLSQVQQQQLDAQMRTQWMQYHNNKWNGQTSWNQYSDPQFLDYVHNNNPSLMTSLRQRFGF